MSRSWLFVVAFFLCACGGGRSSPSSPTAAAPTPAPSPVPLPIILDGITGATVQGATVNPPRPGRGERVMVTAADHLTREQLFTLEPIRLWPAGLDYVRQLVYTHAATGKDIAMRAWQGSAFVVSLPPEIEDDPRPRSTFEEAARDASRVSGLDIHLGTGGLVVLVIDPDAFFNRPGACASTRLWLRGDGIVRAEIVYPNRETAVGLAYRCDRFGVAAHELAHVLGLQHVEDPTALMNVYSSATVYNQKEEDALTMMYHHRRPGNAIPDREVGLAAGDRRLRVETIWN